MKIAIYTNDLNEHNIHLMPWRTVLEVAACLNRSGQNSIILSGSQKGDEPDWTSKKTHIKAVQKPLNKVGLDKLAAICRDERVQVLYWPLDWSGPRIDVLLLENAGLRVIWYVPGAYYRLLPVVKAVPYVSLKAVLPYLVQAMMPKRYFVHQLIKKGVRPLIMMSDFSRAMAIRGGYPEKFVFSIPPGKAPLVGSNHKSSIFEETKEKIGDRPYFLFFGPPQAIRGVVQILKAFKRILSKNAEVCLVCLFRKDKELDAESLRERIENIKFGKQLICMWESVNKADLDLFLRHCYAVVKPFLLVPSEIPLAVIETAGYGKPVIVTGPDGTGCFAEQFGLMVPPANSRALAGAMLQLLKDSNLYSEKCSAASQVYQNHPTWRQVALEWLEVGYSLAKQQTECKN